MKNLPRSRSWTWITAPRMGAAMGVAIAAAIVLSTLSACSLFDWPLGPQLQITPPTPTPTGTPTPTETPTAAVTETETPTPTGGLCGQQGSITVLLLGEGVWENHPLRGASAIRLVKVDYDAGTVRVLALPPHLRVPTPALAEAGIDASELVFVFRDAMPLGTGSERARMAYATNVLAQTLVDNFYLVPDNYIYLAQGTFVDTIDALGGLSIDLPEDVDGSPSGFRYFYAGRQVMDGQSVLDYVRIYPAAGDASPIEWERTARQRQVLDALRVQLNRPQTLVRLPALTRQFYQDVVTDLSLKQVSTLACVFQSEDVSIEQLALGPEMVTVGPDEVLRPKMELVMAFLETSFFQ